LSPLPFDLNDLYFFTVVVDRGGFSAAAVAIGVPKSRLSRHIADLERSVGTRLLQRNTRRLDMTEAGREFYDHCTKVMAQAQSAHLAMHKRTTEPVGTIRMSATVAVADWLLVDALPRFLADNPKVQVALQATNRFIDLLEEHVDLAVRGMKAEPEPSEIVQAGFCSVRWGLFASPKYLEAVGEIAQPHDLTRADALMYRSLDELEPAWRLTDSSNTVQVHRPPVRLQTDNMSVLKRAALADLGICELPLYACRAELAAGSLLPVLPDLRPRHGRLAILFPSRSGMSPAVRRLVEFLKAELPPLLQPHELVDEGPQSR